jgi:hypothetical protein
MHGAGLLLLSSSRVYLIPTLASLPLRTEVRPVRFGRNDQTSRWFDFRRHLTRVLYRASHFALRQHQARFPK